MDTKKIAYFLEVVKHKSIQKAARKMGMDKSILNKAIKSLEEELDAQLYIHYDKTFRLTQTGEFVSKYFQRFLAVHQSLLNDLSSLKDKPRGKLDIVCSTGFVNFFGIRLMTAFSEKHENIYLSFKTNDLRQMFDVGTDVCIGPKITDKGITSVYFYSYWLKMYASKSYLDKKGYPKKPEDLNNHQLIAYSQHLQSHMMDFDWHLKYGSPNGVPRVPFLEITSSYALKEAAERGLGIITFSEFLIERDSNNLINIFPEEGVRVDCYFSYRTEQETFWPLVAYRDYLLDYFSHTAAYQPPK